MGREDDWFARIEATADDEVGSDATSSTIDAKTATDPTDIHEMCRVSMPGGSAEFFVIGDSRLIGIITPFDPLWRMRADRWSNVGH